MAIVGWLGEAWYVKSGRNLFLLQHKVMCGCVLACVYMGMCRCAFVYVHTCTHVYMDVCMNACMCVYVCIGAFVCVHAYSYECVWGHVCLCVAWACVCVGVW